MDRRILLKTLVVALTLMVVCMSSAYAEKHHSLIPLLIDLKGWKAEDANGMSMDMGMVKMVNAVRFYENGDQEINAMLMISNNAMTQGQMQEMTSETAEARVSITKIDGFKVHTGYNKNEKVGSVFVYLVQHQAESAVFMFAYEGISAKEALRLAKKFNWKKMKAAVEKLF